MRLPRWTACAAGGPRPSAPRSLRRCPRREKVDLTMSDWRVYLVDDDAGLTAILREARIVAVLGAKADPSEAAHYVPAYLVTRGYRVQPVNPKFAGRRLHDAPTVAGLKDLSEPADVVEIFRRPEYLSGHADEILTLPWRPKAVWFQLGIRNDAAAEKLARAGIRVVQDRCMRSEEHTSELQSRLHLVCRLLLEKKKDSRY